MKKRTGIYTVMAMLLLSGIGSHLNAHSVQYVRSVDFNKMGNKKGIGSLLLGKKERRAIIPGSIFELDRRRLAVTDAVNGLVIILNKDGKMATVVMNSSESPVTYNLIVGDAETQLEIPAHAIQTLVY